MANQYINKFILGTEVKFDLTQDDITPDKLAKGIKAHDKSGAPIVGTMPNNGAKHLTITNKDTPVPIPMGFHDGSGDAAIDADEAAKLIPANIREGITVLGVEGSMSGSEGVKPQAKTATPTFAQQEVTPDSPTYNYLSSVTVAAIPVTYTDNEQGGQTLKVGA